VTIKELDAGNEAAITQKLLACCGSSSWVKRMLAARPYGSFANLQALAQQAWWRLDPADWLEAFSKHPKIGETGKVSQWSSQEQSGMNSTAAEVAAKLAEMNQVYFDKFGWIFIVCATGKSAGEMLTLLESRLPNLPTDEIRIAAAEQNKITLLRLEKLLL
jgi:2-oxo-4-hydroxy-4-carboxy-5-ureidoimidazoline decarboxylase